MTSPRQHAANARNARKARGPVTSKGKAASSRNAIKHGLNQKIDPVTHPAVAIIAELYTQEGVDPEAARRLAQAHVERERVRSARIDIWRSEYLTREISNREMFYYADADILSELSMLSENLGDDSCRQNILPSWFLAPNEGEVERDADVASRVLKRRSALYRYEVRTVNQLKKAARAAFLPLPKLAKIKTGKPLKV